jgi:hypothetical protein
MPNSVRIRSASGWESLSPSLTSRFTSRAIAESLSTTS